MSKTMNPHVVIIWAPVTHVWVWAYLYVYACVCVCVWDNLFPRPHEPLVAVAGAPAVGATPDFLMDIL